MATANIVVHGLVVNDQRYDGGNDKVVSRVWFDVTANGVHHKNCSCSV
jgi:hypothetical protein